MCRRVCVLALFLGLLHPARAQADIIRTTTIAGGSGFDFGGALVEDNDTWLFVFDVTVESLFTAQTTSWGTGGFDPLLSLFDMSDSRGLLLMDNDDADPAGVFDSLITSVLQPGTYALSVTQFLNYSNFYLFAGSDPGVLDYGFTYDDTPVYTVDLFGYECAFGCLDSTFAGTVSLVPQAPATVPEPATLVLMSAGLAAGLIRRARGRRHRPH